jgi:hypothetical protein
MTFQRPFLIALSSIAGAFSLSSHANALHSISAENFATYSPEAQAIDIQRTLGESVPERMTICIDHKRIATLHMHETVRIYLRPTRTHDVYLVTQGMTTCDKNQAVQGVDIPTENTVWNVGVEHNDTIKIFRAVKQ